MSQEKKFGFTLSPTQLQKINEWALEQDEKIAKKQGKSYPNYGSIGGAYGYKFIPTTIGMIVKVDNCVTKEEIDITEDI